MSDRVETGGLSSALALLGAAGRVNSETEQPDMFECGDAPMPLPPVERTGKAGRPAGAVNKSTEAWVRYHLGRFKSPLTVLAELHSRPLADLVHELQAIANDHAKVQVKVKVGDDGTIGSEVVVARINPLEVLKMQRDAAAALLPYIHKKQPLALEMDMKQRGIVVIGSLDMGGMGGDDDLALPLPPLVENQQVTDASIVQSDERQSDGHGNASGISNMGEESS